MKQKLITGLLSVTMLLGLASCAQNPGDVPAGSGGVPTEVQGSEIGGAGDGAVAGSIACPFNLTPKEKDTYPYMGASISLPEDLRNAVLDNVIFMLTDEDVEYTDLIGQDRVPIDWRPTPEHTVMRSGYVELQFLPENMRDGAPHPAMTTPMSNDDFQVWIKDAVPMARISLYLKDTFSEDLLDENGFENHQKLGENSSFVYYLSTNKKSDELPPDAESLFAAIDSIADGVEIFEARQVDEFYFGILTPEKKAVSQVGDFKTVTITGEPIDQSVFSDTELTMVNVWTTWCGPCIEELPDLGELSDELKGTGVQIIGIVLDTADGRGTPDEEMLELAKTITERTKVNYPCLVPDSNLSEGLLQGVLGFPTTWFVDSEGNVVGDPVLGSNSKEDWKNLILERLAEVDQ